MSILTARAYIAVIVLLNMSNFVDAYIELEGAVQEVGGFTEDLSYVLEIGHLVVEKLPFDDEYDPMENLFREARRAIAKGETPDQVANRLVNHIFLEHQIKIDLVAKEYEYA